MGKRRRSTGAEGCGDVIEDLLVNGRWGSALGGGDHKVAGVLRDKGRGPGQEGILEEGKFSLVTRI